MNTRPRIDFASVLLLLVPLAALFPFRNNDLWWHLAAGRWMVSHSAFPGADPFSHTAFMGHWVDNEWLAELLFYGVWRIAGNPGLILLRVVLITTVFMLIREYLRAARRPSMTLPAMVVGIAISYSWWELRPSLFSLIGMLLLLIVLEGVRRGRAAPWLLPCLFLPWANLHPGFLFGLLVLVATIAVLWLETRLSRASRWSRDRRSRVRLSLWSAASVVVTLVNPYGLEIFHQQIVIAQNLRYRELLDEWAPPSVPFLLLALLAIGAFLALRFGRVPLVVIVPILAATLLSTTAVRFEEYFGLIAVPAMLAQLGPVRGGRAWWLGGLVVGGLGIGLLPPMGSALHEGGRAFGQLDAVDLRVQGRAWRNTAVLAALSALSLTLASVGGRSRLVPRVRRLWRGARSPAASASIGVVLAAALLMVRPLPGDGVEPGRYPDACLATLPDDCVPFNRLSWGGWLIWKRGLRTYIDGRCWGQSIFFEYREARSDRGLEILKRRGIDTVILPPFDPLVTALDTSDAWTNVCRDDAAVVYRLRSSP